MQAGAMKQQRYDQNAVSLDQSISRAEQIVAMPNSKDALNRDRALDTIYNIRDKYVGKDLSNSMVVRQMNNEIRSAVSPADIKRWEETYKGWQAQEKHKQQQIARGEYNEFLDDDPANVEGGYDSSVSGTYNYLSPTHQSKEKYLAPLTAGWSKGRTLGSTVEGYRSIGRDETDLETVLGQADQISTSTWGQNEIKLFKRKRGEEAEALGNDPVEIMTQILRENAEPKMWDDIRGSRTPATKGNALDFLGLSGFDSSVAKRGDTNNRSRREVMQEIAADKASLSVEQTKLENLKRDKASPEEIQAVVARIENAQEKINEYEDRLKTVDTEVSADFEQERENLNAKYVDVLMTENDMTRKDALDVLSQIDKLDLTSVFESSVSPVGGKTSPGYRAAARSAINGVTVGKINNRSERKLVDYMKESDSYRADYNEALNQVTLDEFSYTLGTREILMPQIKDSNRYYTVQGFDGEEYPSFVDPAVTTPLKKNPNNWVIHSNDSDLDQQNSNLRKYIRLSALEDLEGDEGYRTEYESMDRQIRPDGSLRLNYSLTGPKINDGTKLYVDMKYDSQEDKDAIDNVLKQQLLQGSNPQESLSMIQELKASMYFTPTAMREGSGVYDLSDGKKVTVEYENGQYNIYLPTEGGLSQVGTADNREVLGTELARLDALMMTGTLR